MSAGTSLAAIVLCGCASFGQTFEVASVKASERAVGRDENNRVEFSASGVRGRNVTLKRLIGEAYRVQPYQVTGGPKWLEDAEYDIDAHAGGAATQEQMREMLRTLLHDRFRLDSHRESRELRAYELVVDKGGPKLHAVTDGGVGRFRGDMQQLANLISVQLTIPAIDDPGKPSVASAEPVPVIDKTGLSGTYGFPEIRPEAGVDAFTLWQRALRDQAGLQLTNQKASVEVVVVDRAERIPTVN